MNKMKIVGVLMMFAFAITSLSAQKFGHINSQELLLESPDIKAADSKLEVFQKGLMDKGQQMVVNFESEYKKLMTEANAKTLSPVQLQAKEAALGEKQKAIQKYELEVKQKLALKREELYSPIVAKINKAIQDVGKEGGYTMIFDSATGALLHAVDSENIMTKVKAKL